jgi:hypothetical protein
MTLLDPRGLWLLVFAPVLLLVLAWAFRPRRRVLAAFSLLLADTGALPLLSSSYRRRRRLQAVALVLAVVSLALGASGLVVGQASSPPVVAIVLVDHLANWRDAAGAAAGWDGMGAAAGALLGRFRHDDRVLLLRSDVGLVGGGLLPPRQARILAAQMLPSELPLELDATADLLGLLVEMHHARAVFVLTPAPGRWSEVARRSPVPPTVIATPAPARAGNAAVFDVEVSRTLLQPSEVGIFFRVGYQAPPGDARPLAAGATVRNNSPGVRREAFALPAGGERVFELPRKVLEPGLLQVRLEPPDAFPGDNVFSTAIRSRPFQEAVLVSAGNPQLEAALRALPGLSLTLERPGANLGAPSGKVVVFDGVPPQPRPESQLVIHPPGSYPGIVYRGEAQNLRLVDAESGHPLLRGVSLTDLTLERLPVYEPEHYFEVIAHADGHPLVLLGRTPQGGRIAQVSFDPREAAWVHTPSFPILIANLMGWLGEESAGSRSYFRVGESLPEHLSGSLTRVVDPDARSHGADRLREVVAPFARAGEYRVTGAGGADARHVLFVNLLDEGVSRAAVPPAVATAWPEPPSIFPRPFRFDASGVLVFAAALFLFAEWAVAPRATQGRWQT